MPRSLRHGGRRRPAWSRRAPARTARTRDLASAAASAFVTGIAVEYFLPPRSGRRRRRLLRDRARSTLRRSAREVGRQTRYESGKVVGLAHKMSQRDRATPELDDISLVRKVQTELFRDHTIPKGRVKINADRGIVVLRGQLDNDEDIRRIERGVRGIAGVRDVESLLHLPGTPAPASRPHGDPRATHPAA